MNLDPFVLDGRRWRFLCNHKKLVHAFKRVHPHRRPMQMAPTKRQAQTARCILKRIANDAQRGVLLADDVGTGKTTVAAWVALVVAGTKLNGQDRGKVLVLAPNATMVRRWQDELNTQADVLRKMRTCLDLREGHDLTTGTNLMEGRIIVRTHGHGIRVGKQLPPCDLLIVDEAHRAKGAETAFAKRLKRARNAARVLFLTATPFSISIAELATILRIIGVEDKTIRAVRRLAQKFEALSGTSPIANVDEFAKELHRRLKQVIESISSYVIRSTLSKKETGLYEHRPGTDECMEKGMEWSLKVRPAGQRQLEILLRMDRLLALAKRSEVWRKQRTNDARYHVGWRKLVADLDALSCSGKRVRANPECAGHLRALRRLLRDETPHPHPKISAVAQAVCEVTNDGEKVLVFCDHHAVAEEVAIALHNCLRSTEHPRWLFTTADWRHAWEKAFKVEVERSSRDLGGLLTKLSNPFVKWLCSPGIVSQVATWLGEPVPRDVADLASRLRTTRPRNAPKRSADSILEEACRLLENLVGSRSGRRILEDGRLPGQRGGVHVVGYCETSGAARHCRLFWETQHETAMQPDALMMVFNSPFGPDVLVTTDRLSEGVDLHGFCRHLIHYEMDPSPLRAVQREGRVWRINSWAARSGEPVCIAYPAFGGTRDERLVRIVRMRRNAFSLLFGGTNYTVDGEMSDAVVKQQEQVLEAVRRMPGWKGKNPFSPRT